MLERCLSEERSEESAVAGFASAVGQTCAQVLKRPEVTVEQLVPDLAGTRAGIFRKEFVRVLSARSLP